MAQLGGKLREMKDKMGFGLYPDEQVAFLKLLHQWKMEKQNRQIVVIGGDLHMAVRTEIRYKGDLIFEQLVTSPIRQHSPPGLGYNLMKSVMSTVEELEDDYSYKHTMFKPRRNFGIINIETHEGGTTVMRGTIYYQRKLKKKEIDTSSVYCDGQLLISDISGRNLISKDSNGLSDPYFKFKFSPHHVKTDIIKKTLNPTFSNALKMDLTQENYIAAKLGRFRPPVLMVALRDYNTLKDVSMGRVEIDLSDLIANKGDFSSRTKNYRNVAVQARHKEKVSGMISFTLTFRPST